MRRASGPSLPIDVRIPGVGRVKKRSGVRSRAERDDLVAMLRLLPRQGHLELVRDVQAGRRRLGDVYAHFVAGTLAQLEGPQLDQLLAELLVPWLDTAQCADGTRQNRRDAFRALCTDGRRAYRLGDLPAMLQARRRECEAADNPRAFNIARTCVQAFVRDVLGKRTPLALAIADVPMLKERGRGRPGVDLAQALEVRAQLGAEAAAIWWSMCTTGMGPGELWGTWHVLGDRVHVVGTKTDHRVRDVPLVQAPGRPTLTRPGFESALRRLSERRLRIELARRLDRAPTADELAKAWEIDGAWKVNPYQGRKTFDRWMQQAGVPRARRLLYLGHVEQDVSDRYELYEVEAYLAEDATRMRDLLPKKGIRLAS